VATLRALLWDVDGTLAETERDGHRPAFNRAFAEAGLPLHWDPRGYGRWLAISGGRERIAVQLHELEGQAPQTQRVEALQAAKQSHYRNLMQQRCLQLRPGVVDLLREAHQAGLCQVIVTTSSRAAIRALMDHLLGPLEPVFRFWVCGDDVRRKKPHPEAYGQALQRLLADGLAADPAELLVIEDSDNGLRAARAAGLACVVTCSHYSSLASLADRNMAAAVVSQLGHPARVLHGPACQDGQITLSYLQSLVR
jgi:HAD superfamily hydrolase (TIGR01509 family)